jgi:hypothetical protein
LGGETEPKGEYLTTQKEFICSIVKTQQKKTFPPFLMALLFDITKNGECDKFIMRKLFGTSATIVAV